MRREPRAVAAGAGDDERVRRLIGQRTELDALVDDVELQAARDRAPRDERGPSALARAAEHRVQQVAGGVVDPVRVLDDQQRPARRQQRRQQTVEGLVDLRAGELGRHARGLLRRRQLEPERDADQRQQRGGIGQVALDGGGERVAERPLGVVVGAEQAAQRRLQGEVRRRRPVRPALDDDAAQIAVGALGDELGEQPRLAHPGLGDELDEPPLASARRAQRIAQDPQLAFAADKRALGHRPRGGHARLADEPGVDRLGPAAHDEGRDGLDRPWRTGVVEHRARREHGAVGRAAHHAGGQVRRGAHRGVRAPPRSTEVHDERAAAGDPGPHAQISAVAHDLAHREQHPVLVVGRRGGRAADGEDLARADVRIGAQERHAVLAAGALRAGDELVQLLGGRRRAVARQQLVEAAELREGDRDEAVLALGVRAEMVVQRRGQAAARIAFGDRLARQRRRGRRARDEQRRAPDAGGAAAGRAERRARRAAEQDLPGSASRSRPATSLTAGPATTSSSNRSPPKHSVADPDTTPRHAQRRRRPRYACAGSWPARPDVIGQPRRRAARRPRPRRAPAARRRRTSAVSPPSAAATSSGATTASSVLMSCSTPALPAVPVAR